jgi:hypothetical protein
MKGIGMFSRKKRSVLAALCAVVFCAVLGCTNSRALSRQEHDPLRFDYDSFVQVPRECMVLLKDSVEKKYGPEYSFKNAILSREKPYREAIFSRIEGKSADSTVVVKFDSLCVIKRIFRSLMTITGEE